LRGKEEGRNEGEKADISAVLSMNEIPTMKEKTPYNIFSPSTS
jgi:hypothetical protein